MVLKSRFWYFCTNSPNDLVLPAKASSMSRTSSFTAAPEIKTLDEKRKFPTALTDLSIESGFPRRDVSWRVARHLSNRGTSCRKTVFWLLATTSSPTLRWPGTTCSVPVPLLTYAEVCCRVRHFVCFKPSQVKVTSHPWWIDSTLGRWKNGLPWLSKHVSPHSNDDPQQHNTDQLRDREILR